MLANLVQIHRFPIKGLSSQSLLSVDLTSGKGIPRDRLYAFAHGASKFDTENPRPLAKGNFLMLMLNGSLAKLEVNYDELAQNVNICFPDKHVVSGKLDDYDDQSRIEKSILEFVGEQARGCVTLVSAPDHILTDVGKPYVSIINLATVRCLEKKWGVAVDPLRFRGNFLIDDADPWEEFSWIDQIISIGNVKLRVVKRTVRCAATTVNPSTAERDIELPKKLMNNFGHKDCGVYAEVITDGTVQVGDTLSF